jgi:hypothetical protein
MHVVEVLDSEFFDSSIEGAFPLIAPHLHEHARTLRFRPMKLGSMDIYIV